FQPFPLDVRLRTAKAGHVAARPRQALYESADEWIGAPCHHDRNVGRDCSRGARGDNAVRQDDVDPSIHQGHRKLRQTGDISVAPLRDQHEIAPLHPAATGKPAQECPEVALGRWCSPQEADPSHPLALLRARRERARSHRAAKQRDELAALHSITSSASASSLSGTSRPSTLAVLRLMTNSNLTGASTGKSAGLAPFRMRSIYEAVRRKISRTSGPYDIRPPSATNDRYA